jgi:DNA-binding transcriptional ArsR family regulator
MTDARSLAGLAHLLADPTRAGVCLALLDGRAWTAGELARAAGVAPSTTSVHLDLLVEGGLLAQERQGRHRYLRLADARTATLVEGLAAHADPAASPTGSLRVVSAHHALVDARTCYDHLAGRLGVAVLDALCDKGYVSRLDGLALTRDGLDWLSRLGVDVPALRASRRPLVRDCLDWTERRHHLAGAVGAAVCERFVTRGWVEGTRRPRALRVTAAGRAALSDELGLGWAA